MHLVQFRSLFTLSCTAYQYNKYKQYSRKGRLTGECGSSVVMMSTFDLHLVNPVLFSN